MPNISAFQAFIPNKKIINKVATKSVDAYSKQEIDTLLCNNPLSFLQITKGVHNNTWQDNRKVWDDFVQKEYVVLQQKPAYYIYQQRVILSNKIHTGIVALIDTDDYTNGDIKLHEQTLADREQKLCEYLKVVQIQAEPILFTYPENVAIETIIALETQEEPAYFFEKEEAQHSIWVIDNPEKTAALHYLLNNIDSVYIADGHHRAASSAQLATHYPELVTVGKMLGFFLSDANIDLLAYHRLLKVENQGSVLELLSTYFEIQENAFTHRHRFHYEIFHEKKWYHLYLKKEYHSEDLLDVEIASSYIINIIYDEQCNLRTDKRVKFLPDKYTKQELENKVEDFNCNTILLLPALTLPHFFKYVNKGNTMPPKSTWFEPKLLNGLMVYDLFSPSII